MAFGIDSFTDALLKDAGIDLEKIIKECVKEGQDEAWKEYTIFLVNKLKEIYNLSVDKFYDSYDPHFYKRKGDIESKTGGLYELLNIVANEDIIRYEFNEELVTYRDGSSSNDEEGSLYDLVFRKGWHGGATYVSDEKIEMGLDPHPNPGIPYYRSRKNRYRTWSYQAVHSKDKAVLKTFNKLKQEYEDSDEYNSDYSSIIYKHIQNKINEKMKSINKGV